MTKREEKANGMKTAPIHRRFLFLFLCFAAMAGGARAGAETPAVTAAAPARASYTFPFTSLFYGAPVVEAKINDTVTATFLIDTGSSANFISQTVVDKLGLKPQDAHLTRDPSFLEGKQPMFVSPQKVLAGSLTLQGGAYLVESAKELAVGCGGAVDGIIGMQLLRYFAVDLDFPRHQITLWFPNGLADDAVKQAGFSDAFTVPLIPSIPDSIIYDPVKAGQSTEAYWRLYYSVPVQIGDGLHVSQQSLLLDTAGGVTLFPSEVSRALNLEVQGTMPLSKPTYGSQRVNIVQAPTIQIGSLCLLNQTVEVFQSGTAGEGPAHKTAALGLNLLSGYRILMDFGAKKMYFKPNIPQIKIGAPPDKKPSKNSDMGIKP